MVNLDTHKYARWYRDAKDILGDTLRSLPENDVSEWVSRNDWLIFPLPDERNRNEAENRPQPNIYMEIGDGTIRMGLVCNTLESVERMENLLDSYHSKERTQFLEEMQKLDDDFTTSVHAKLKDDFRASPKYRTEATFRSNLIDDERIKSLFSKAASIRKEGTRLRLKSGRRYPPETPVIDLAAVEIPIGEATFKRKLAQLKIPFELSLSVKTAGQIKRLKKTAPKVKVVKYRCLRCRKGYAREELDRGRFCPADGTRVAPTVSWISPDS